jgi:hypothetical protein
VQNVTLHKKPIRCMTDGPVRSVAYMDP